MTFMATVVTPFMKSVEPSNRALNTSLSEAQTTCATMDETTKLLVREMRTCCQKRYHYHYISYFYFAMVIKSKTARIIKTSALIRFFMLTCRCNI